MKKREQTGNKVIQVFLSLLRDRPIEKISVTDICHQAGINRSTFYDHFESVHRLAEAAFDFLNEEMIRNATRDFQPQDVNYIAEDIITRTLAEVKKNKRLLLHFVEYRGNLIELKDSDTVRQLLHERNLTDDIQLKYNFSFFESGVNGIVFKWVKNNCAEPEQEISRAIVTIIHRLFDEIK